MTSASAQEFFGWGPNEFTAILMIFSLGLITAQLFVVIPATNLLGLRNVGLLACSLLSLGRRALGICQGKHTQMHMQMRMQMRMQMHMPMHMRVCRQLSRVTYCSPG